VTVLVVNVETMDLAEEEDGEYKMRELVREHHQPSHVLSQPGNEKHEEKGDKAQRQIPMKLKPPPGKVHPEGLDQDADGKHDENGQQDAVQHKGDRLNSGRYFLPFRHSQTNVSILLNSSKNLFTFESLMHLNIDRMTDNELIRGIRENSPAAWRELYKENYDKIRAKIAPMLVRTKDVTFDDLFDDAMLTLMDNVKDGKVVEGASTNLSGYLYTICWRMALRRETKSKRTEEAGKMQEPVEEEDTSVEPEEYAEAMAFLDRVFESIPPKCKSILKRFYWDKLPMSEIAAIHGLRNENSAKTTKNRCMDKFKEIAKAMLADDAKADEAVRRTVERNALRDLLEEIRKEKDGEWARAALEDKDKGK